MTTDSLYPAHQKAFEKWAINEGYNLDRSPTGHYQDSDIYSLYAGFVGGRREEGQTQSQEIIAELCEAVEIAIPFFKEKYYSLPENMTNRRMKWSDRWHNAETALEKAKSLTAANGEGK